MTRPVNKLVAPEAVQAFPGPIDSVLSVNDWLSLSHWMMKAVELVTGGLNPGAEAAKWFVGDWEAFAKAGDALQHLGSFHGAYAEALTGGKDTMLTGWEGNAAEAAGKYFDGLAEAVAAQEALLRDMGQQVKHTAFGIWGLADVVNGLLEQLLDALVEVAVLLAASALASETVIVGLLFFGIAAWRVKKAAGLWLELLDCHDKVYAVAKALTGLLAGTLGAVRGMQQHPLPAGAYDHPGA